MTDFLAYKFTVGSEDEAQAVLDGMHAALRNRAFVTVGELHELIGKSPSYVHDRYGWFDLSTARIHESDNGYYLDLPEPQKLRAKETS